MPFASWSFIAFLSALVVIYRAVPPRARGAVLTAGSLAFLALAGWPSLVTLLVCVSLTYGCARTMAASKGEKARRRLLVASVLGNLGLVAATRYGRTAAPSEMLSWSALGLSFYVLQAIDYAVTVYRQRTTPRFFELLQYLAFFPKLPAGPIEPAEGFLAQEGTPSPVDLEEGLTAGKRILWGLFKKIVIADRLSAIVAPVFATPEVYAGPAVLLCVYALAIQIYCDFSGYCDIAIGAARLFGYRLSENFDKPYAAGSIREFWRRWHMTLTLWLRDHVYLPLGGNRVGAAAWVGNILAVFLVSGLWHGAQATFLVWAGLHASYYLLGRGGAPFLELLRRAASRSFGPRATRIFAVALTFHLVAVAWIPFAAKDLDQAGAVAAALTRGWTPSVTVLIHAAASLLQSLGSVNGGALGVALLIWWGVSSGRKLEGVLFGAKPGMSAVVEVALLDVLLLLLLLSGEFAGTNFMYVNY